MLIERLLKCALQSLVRTGALTFVLAGGQKVELGDGAGPPVVGRFTDASAPWALLLDPDLRTGELFTEGRLVIDQGSIYEMLHIVLRHGDQAPPTWWSAALDRLRAWLRLHGPSNDLRRSRQNVSHHYDLDDRLYALFLDPEWQYSCAYFEHPGQALADAQRAKMRHIAAKLAGLKDKSVLDIGCGWGGLACYLAGVAQAESVLGVTLSIEQLKRAQCRARERGLDVHAVFALRDYRAVEGQFDRIVSVGMFEHVGRANYVEFFRTCFDRLARDGVMLLHTIGLSDGPSLTNPWLTRYIFPGGHLPALSEMLPAIEAAGLVITDIEILRFHYAETLRAWRDAFMRRRKEAAALFDERFCRMWEYYLAMSEAAFRCEGVVVFQLQLAHELDAVPIARDYIRKAELELKDREALRTRLSVAGGAAYGPPELE